MTPHVVARLTIHEPEGAASIAAPRFRPGLRSIEAPALIARPRPGLSGARRGVRLRREAVQRRLLAAADLIGAAVALGLVAGVPAVGGQPGLLLFAAVPLVVAVFKIAGLYDRDQLRLVHSTLDETPLLLQLTGLYVLAVAIAQSALTGGALRGDGIAALWLCTFVLIAGGRVLARWIGGRTTPHERCLVIGEHGRAERLREKLRSSGARATVVATFPLEAGADVDPLDPESIRFIVDELEVHRIIIAPTVTESAGIVEQIRIAKAAGVQVSVLPRMLEVVGSAVEFDDVDGLPMLGVGPFGLSRSSHLVKRAFDIVATTIGLIAVAPIFLTVLLAIRLDTRGPVFFRQVRVGRDGRQFRIFKFRSMVMGAEAEKDSLRSLNEVGEGMFKIHHDPRVTRVGSFLRRTSLDELPQLLNVLRGEMSLVGPRPLVTDEDAQVLGLDRSRLHLTPGMTGPWQILGARVPMQEMVGIDYLYVSSWTLWQDVKLLVRTLRHVCKRGNA